MAGFFSRLLGWEEKSAPQVRKLSSPGDLREGDIIKFQHLPQLDISGQEFEVSKVNTYIYGQMCYPELVLKNRSGDIIYMMHEDEDGEEYLALSRKVKKANINEIISQEDIDLVKKKGTGTKVKILNTPEHLKGWLLNAYQEVDDCVKGSFVKGDARYLSESDVKKREPFVSYILEDPEGEFALELEMYDTGEMELSVTVYHDISILDEMWPGNTKAEK